MENLQQQNIERPIHPAARGITEQILSDLCYKDNSLGGVLLGLLAEANFINLLISVPGVSSAKKIPNSSGLKMDYLVIYYDTPIRIECKTQSVRETRLKYGSLGTIDFRFKQGISTDNQENNEKFEVIFSDESIKNTVYRQKSSFDIYAVNTRESLDSYIFIKSEDIPCLSKSVPGFTDLQRSELCMGELSISKKFLAGEICPYTRSLSKILEEVRVRKTQI